MENYRHSFDPSSRKFICPGCDKRRFVRYVDNATGDYLPEQFGKCDRESKCGYFMKPETKQPEIWIPPPPRVEPPPALIPNEVFSETLKDYDQNNFIINLQKNVPYPFLKEDVSRIIDLYQIGTAPDGFTCFPFISKAGNIHGVQEKIFDC